LIGSILDAHKNICISHELNVLDLFLHDYNFSQIRYLITRNSKRYAKNGRKWEGYDYSIHEQYQGNINKLLVIGDKKGGTTSNLLRKYPDLLNQFQESLPLPIKIIHVIRNPYDCISTRFIKNINSFTLEDIIDMFFNQAKCVLKMKTQTEFDILDVHIEKFIISPDRELKRILKFFEVKDFNSYIDDCIKIIFPVTKKTRHEISWSKETKERINKEIRKFDFFKQYSLIS
jgi:hypothetical protein